MTESQEIPQETPKEGVSLYLQKAMDIG